MLRHAWITTFLLAAAIAPVRGQTAFEVAAIKPTAPAFTGRRIQMPLDDNTVTMRGMTLNSLVLYAYDLHHSLLSGGAPWCDRDRYDITAKAGGGRIPSRDERKQMLKALLAERFQLTFHWDLREAAVYTLMVAKSGSKITAHKPEGDGPTSIELEGFAMRVRNASMAEFAGALQGIIPLNDPTRGDRPVLDRSGLTSRYDFQLAWTPEDAQFAGRGDAPSLFTALQEQLGLKLEAAKTQLEGFVIDRAEKPSAN